MTRVDYGAEIVREVIVDGCIYYILLLNVSNVVNLCYQNLCISLSLSNAQLELICNHISLSVVAIHSDHIQCLK